MSDMQLRVCWLYPQQMGIYADRGNIEFLRRRCNWREIDFNLSSFTVDEALDDSFDLYYIGGGQDRDQLMVAADLIATKKAALESAVDRGASVLAVCGGYQLLGDSYDLGDQQVQGLGLVEMETVREDGPRLIGNVAIEIEIDSPHKLQVVGFENHGGRTYLGPGVTAFGKVVKGFGNNGQDGLEGVRYKNLIGTYLHGPLLPKNFELADYLIRAALTTRYGEVELAQLDDRLEIAAHENALASLKTR